MYHTLVWCKSRLINIWQLFPFPKLILILILSALVSKTTTNIHALLTSNSSNFIQKFPILFPALFINTIINISCTSLLYFFVRFQKIVSFLSCCRINIYSSYANEFEYKKLYFVGRVFIEPKTGSIKIYFVGRVLIEPKNRFYQSLIN